MLIYKPIIALTVNIKYCEKLLISIHDASLRLTRIESQSVVVDFEEHTDCTCSCSVELVISGLKVLELILVFLIKYDGVFLWLNIFWKIFLKPCKKELDGNFPCIELSLKIDYTFAFHKTKPLSTYTILLSNIRVFFKCLYINPL